MSFNIRDIEEVLDSFEEYRDGHHLGRPFATAYQIAVRFSEKFTDHPMVKALPIGGAGTGEYRSLAQQIARFLSQELRPGGNPGRVEGGFISHEYEMELSLRTRDGRTITPSTLRTEKAQSVFRTRRI